MGRSKTEGGRNYHQAVPCWLSWASADVGLADGSVRFPLLSSERGQDLSPSLRKGEMLGDVE